VGKTQKVCGKPFILQFKLSLVNYQIIYLKCFLLVGLKKIKYFFNMFIGEYKHTIDSKNRITIPSKFQPQLAEGAVLTRGLDNCLFLFTMEE